MSLKAFVLGGVLLALSAMVAAFGGEIDPDIDKIIVIVGSILAVVGGTLYVFDR